jgi:hypothetical protein
VCDDEYPEDIAARVVEQFRRGPNDEYYEALNELRHTCSFHEPDVIRYLCEAGLPDVMMKRVRRCLSKGDVQKAKVVFDQAQRYFGSAYILRLEARYGVTARLGIATPVAA